MEDFIKEIIAKADSDTDAAIDICCATDLSLDEAIDLVSLYSDD